MPPRVSRLRGTCSAHLADRGYDVQVAGRRQPENTSLAICLSGAQLYRIPCRSHRRLRTSVFRRLKGASTCMKSIPKDVPVAGKLVTLRMTMSIGSGCSGYVRVSESKAKYVFVLRYAVTRCTRSLRLPVYVSLTVVAVSLSLISYVLRFMKGLTSTEGNHPRTRARQSGTRVTSI